ncbi:MAG: ATP-binding protein [Deltaproteobacteria bacterium]|nr:ATP-binding protein [Deltaproteobacteria bacterium]
MEMLGRFLKDPGTSFFLFGPRGTGKTTWLESKFRGALTVDLLLPDVARSLAARPERLAGMVEGNPERNVVVIDEIQKVPALLDVVHSLMEKHPERRFVLTGSSARKIRRAGVDLLGGRAVVSTLHPFMAAELGGRFEFDEALRTGLVPVVACSPNPSRVLSAYAGLYLREEVQTEGLVRNLGDFSRFLEVMSFSHGSVLNLANVARECEVGRKAVEGYVSILEDLLLGFRLPAFTRRASRAVSVHPKFYYFDAGVYRSLRPSGPLDRREEIEGAALEGLVVQHLRAWTAYRGDKSKLHFWRTRSGVEVDVVLYGDDGFWSLEIKNTARPDSRALAGLKAFAQDYPESKRLLLHRGKDRTLTDGILCVPCEEFLATLHPAHALDHGLAGSRTAARNRARRVGGTR